MRRKQKSKATDRLTVTLAEGQRQALQSIAEKNGATLAFIVRFALREFIRLHTDGQLRLTFPSGEELG